jgi:nucleoside-diphosphate-sugar epimerase
MRAVVTGGAGFIGSHLVEHLLARGDEVICIEHAHADATWVGDLPIDYRDHGVERTAQLRAALDGTDVVFHLAGLTQARRSSEYYAVNTEGTARVLEAASQLGSRAPRIILASSLAAVGPGQLGKPITLADVPRPLSHYGRSKLLAEVMMRAYRDSVPGVILRLPAVYGPRERAVLTFFRMVERGIALTVGEWSREVSMLYVSDLVDGFVAAASNPDAAGQTFHLAHPEPLSWRQFAEVVARELDRDPVLVSVPQAIARVVALGAEAGALVRRSAAILNRDRIREIFQPGWVCDVSLAIERLGFRPRYPLKDGVHATATWYREAGWI